MRRKKWETVKKSSRQVIERYYSKMTLDFDTNKKILEEVALLCQIGCILPCSNSTLHGFTFYTQSSAHGRSPKSR
uniref:Uncharacterized protein n=1 Tax=Salix viminalis TaxID=40686 RepID=A0A6N2N4U7_SALVM